MRHIRRAKLSLATVNRTGVDSLFGDTEAGKMLNHRGDILALHSLDVVVADFASEIRVLGVCFFDLVASSCQLNRFPGCHPKL